VKELEVIYSTLLLAVLGFGFGAFLAYSAQRFKVEEDPRVKMITEVLPGINCGACGFAGCEAYAKAIVKGQAETNRCLPGRPQGVEEKIKKILEEYKNVSS